jgi:hypothetical protein
MNFTPSSVIDRTDRGRPVVVVVVVVVVVAASFAVHHAALLLRPLAPRPARRTNSRLSHDHRFEGDDRKPECGEAWKNDQE